MLLEIDFSSETPIYMQIRNQIVEGIANGSLAADEKLPTIRGLANESGINMMTVNKAYQLLKQEGYIIADRRSGARVSVTVPVKEGFSDKAKGDLQLIILEAKVRGVSKEEILKFCEEVYDGKGGKL